MFFRRSNALTLLAVLAAIATPAGAETPAVRIGPGTSLHDLFSKPDNTVIEGPDGKRSTVGELKIQLRSAPRTTGESPEGPGLGNKLKADLTAANAAAKAGLARAKSQLVNPPLAHVTPTPAPAKAGSLDTKKLISALPCNRVLFTVEGAAVNFQIQPGQLILLNGCFSGAPNAEVRIAGDFPPYGYLLLDILERGDNYFYGQVPDVGGVVDQNVSITIRFFDGVTTNQRNGFFYAKRQSWEGTVNTAVCNSLRVEDSGGSTFVPYLDPTFGSFCGAAAYKAIDVWMSTQRARGVRITKFWWTAVLENQGIAGWTAPSDMRWSDDGSTVLLSCTKLCWYGPTRLRIEGPAGIPPF